MHTYNVLICKKKFFSNEQYSHRVDDESFDCVRAIDIAIRTKSDFMYRAKEKKILSRCFVFYIREI